MSAAVDELRAALETFVRELVADEVARQLEHQVNGNGEGSPWYSRKDAAAYLGISVRTLDRMRKRGNVPSEPIGGRQLLHRADLDALARAATGEDVAPTTSPRRRV